MTKQRAAMTSVEAAIYGAAFARKYLDAIGDPPAHVLYDPDAWERWELAGA